LVAQVQQLRFKYRTFKLTIKSFNRNQVDIESINHCFIHILPRKANDLKRNDDLYPLLEGYDKE
jgi:hypothetical protein